MFAIFVRWLKSAEGRIGFRQMPPPSIFTCRSINAVANKIYAQFEALGIDRRKIAPYFSAPRYCIEALLAHIRKKYGSAADYLESRAGVSDAMLVRLRENLLESVV